MDVESLDDGQQAELPDEGNDFFDMSDEDFLSDDESVAAPVEEPASDDQPTDLEDDADADEQDSEDDGELDTGEPTDPASDSDDDLGDDADSDGSDPDDSDDDEAGEDAQLKSFYDQVTASFKANGRDMKVDNPEDVVRLMQMGANYNRKMAAMKPHLKTLKTLEKFQISEDKLNFLIDIDKKDPAAIAKLLKDSEIDPMGFDTDQDYQTSSYQVDDKEVELDSVIDEIKDSDTYNQTLDIVTTKWDAKSKAAVANEPQLLKLMNDHVAMGFYDLISNEVETERMHGRLDGLNDIQAYNKVGDAIHARGGFDHLTQSQGQGQQSPTEEQASSSKKEVAEKKRRAKRKAAGTPKARAPQAKADDINPLSLSDEEFEKNLEPKFL